MRFFKTYKNIWPGIILLLCFVVFRMYRTHSPAFSFLFWNLFLALLPLYFSYRVLTAEKTYQAWGAAVLWLLFFPNAAYLFTDIVHLRKQGPSQMYWLDLTILVLSSIYGIVTGLLSLSQMECWYRTFVTPALRPVLTCSLLLACGYGIYLGRVERWNSWDVIVQPGNLLQAILHHGRHPFRCKEVWLMSGLFGACLYVLYLLFNQKKRSGFKSTFPDSL